MSGQVSSCNPIQRKSVMLLKGAVEENCSPLRGRFLIKSVFFLGSKASESQPHPLNIPTCINYHTYCYFVITHMVNVSYMYNTAQCSREKLFPFPICDQMLLEFLFTSSCSLTASRVYMYNRKRGRALHFCISV